MVIRKKKKAFGVLVAQGILHFTAITFIYLLSNSIFTIL